MSDRTSLTLVDKVIPTSVILEPTSVILELTRIKAGRTFLSARPFIYIHTLEWVLKLTQLLLLCHIIYPHSLLIRTKIKGGGEIFFRL